LATYGLPIIATLFTWWFSTGAILFLDGLPRRTFRWSFGVASIIAVAALWALCATSNTTSIAGAYVAVLSALMVWGWNEMAFLFGYVTGSRREPSDPDARGLARFANATSAILHHELALVTSALIIGILTWDGANFFGIATFMMLFAMRLSTKLNIFLGVPNTTIEFLPAHLSYLKSYFRNKPMNLLFPFSVTLATAVTVALVQNAAYTDPFLATGFTLLATLAALGLIEHWFLVVPLPVGELWAWGLSAHKASSAVSALRPDSPPAQRATDAATPRTISPTSLVAQEKTKLMEAAHGI
jgi:putative photosynthetic complex assembly protein 2